MGADLCSPDSASHLLAWTKITTTASSQALLNLLASQEPAYKEAINWIQFASTGDWIWDYMAAASTVFFQSLLAERDPLFAPILEYLYQRFLGAYTLPTTSIFGPSITDYYFDNYPTGCTPDHREDGYMLETDPPTNTHHKTRGGTPGKVWMGGEQC